MGNAGIRIDVGHLQAESGLVTASAASAGANRGLLASPNTLQKGQSTTLSWWTKNATDVRIEGVGEVGSDGCWQVTPEDSTTYHLPPWVRAERRKPASV